MSKERIGGMFLSIGFVLAGTGAVAGKGLASVLGPFTIIVAGLVFAMPLLLPFLLRQPQLTGKELGESALLGFFGIFLYRFFLVSALTKVGAAEAGLMIGAAPAFTALASWIFLRERPSIASVLGVSAACVGILLVRFSEAGSSPNAAGTVRVLGLTLALGAAASEAVFFVLSRLIWRSDDTADPRRRTALTALWALLFSLVPAAMEQPFSAIASLHLYDWAALVWYGVFVTALSYICWYEGIRRLEAAMAAVYSSIPPVVAYFLPMILLGEKPNISGAIGCSFVSLGLVVAGYRRRNS